MGMLAMQMTGSNGVFSVPAEHIPGLVVLVALPVVIWVTLFCIRFLAVRKIGWASAFVKYLDVLRVTGKTVLGACVVGALVHAAIVPTHWADERVTAVLFLADTIGFGIAFWCALTQRPYWRTVSVAMLGGTAATYALYVLTGWETMDLVGLLTTTIELAAALLVLSTAPALVSSPGREYRIGLAAISVALVSLLGTGAIASASTSAPSTSPAATSSHATVAASGMKGMPGMKGTTSGTHSTSLALTTNSPAGPITWPDAMTTMAAGMKMATPNCDAQPTSAQKKAAVTLVDQTVAAAAPYKSLAAAKAAGYVPLTPTGARIVHYINPSTYDKGDLLKPSDIPVLVYVNTAHGAVLEAAMYLMPQDKRTSSPPRPGGCLTQWHIHTNLCLSGGKVVGTDSAGSCTVGTNRATPPMMHVWMTSVAGGPLAPDPSARSQIVAANQAPALTQPNGRA
jgi:hypothetical protein